jgi:hypothetical protein
MEKYLPKFKEKVAKKSAPKLYLKAVKALHHTTFETLKL